jgi:hypothetical protein
VPAAYSDVFVIDTGMGAQKTVQVCSTLFLWHGADVHVLAFHGYARRPQRYADIAMQMFL